MDPTKRYIDESVIITTTERSPPRHYASPPGRGVSSPGGAPPPSRRLFSSTQESIVEEESFVRAAGPLHSTRLSGAAGSPRENASFFNQSLGYSTIMGPSSPSRLTQNQTTRTTYDESTLSQTQMEQQRKTPQSKKKKKKPESVLQWFDRTCERELSKRQIGTFDTLNVNQHGLRGLDRPEMVEASASGIDVVTMLRGEQNTELHEACDKLAKAQAMDIFKGAVKAAEEAAANAPPEYAEEAAAAGARGYQAELTSVLQERIPGCRPMEVIGYVGITRPKYPKRMHQHQHHES